MTIGELKEIFKRIDEIKLILVTDPELAAKEIKDLKWELNHLESLQLQEIIYDED